MNFLSQALELTVAAVYFASGAIFCWLVLSQIAVPLVIWGACWLVYRAYKLVTS